jgi:hypothetical protein
MKFLERHWWVIIALIALWAYANYGPSNTTIGGDTTGSSSGGLLDPAVDAIGGDSVWAWLGTAAVVLGVLLL